MAQAAKLEVQLDVKSSAQKFYEIFRSKRYLFLKICPGVVKDVRVIKGDWESVGSIKQWTYVAGDSETCKDMVEAIDEENKTITFKILDGEATKYYRTLRTRVQVIGKGDKGGSLVKWTIIEYEKINDDLPDPIQYLELFSVIIKNIDVYLTTN